MILSRVLGYGLILSLGANAVLYGLWQHADGEIAKREAVVAKSQVMAVEAANERARQLQRALDSLPKAEGKIREIVRDNPAACERPKPVADGLSEAIRAANAARKVPADS